MDTRAKKILVVDDDVVTVTSLRRAIEKFGITVVTASTIAEARLMMAAEKPRAILLDLHFQGESGLDWLQELRRLYSAVELPVLIVTGDQDQSVFLEALKHGANDYVGKPISGRVVVARLQTLLNLQDMHYTSLKLEQWDAVRAMITTYNHQINSPLTAALGYVDHMRRTNAVEKIDELERSLENVAKIIRKMRDLTSESMTTAPYLGKTKMIDLGAD